MTQQSQLLARGSEAMPGRLLSYTEVILFALVIASGMLGGGAAASHYVIKGHTMKYWIVLAYTIMGGFFASCVMLLHEFGFLELHNTREALAVSVVVGFAGTLLMTATNLSAQFILKKLGLKVTINVDKVD